jgi:hypothetical protein
VQSALCAASFQVCRVCGCIDLSVDQSEQEERRMVDPAVEGSIASSRDQTNSIFDGIGNVEDKKEGKASTWQTYSAELTRLEKRISFIEVPPCRQPAHKEDICFARYTIGYLRKKDKKRTLHDWLGSI